MKQQTIFALIIIISIVFTRANVFAQITYIGQYTAENFKTDELTEKLLNETIDSVLTSRHLTRVHTWLVVDTLREDSTCAPPSRGLAVHSISRRGTEENQYTARLIIRHFERNRQILTSSDTFEEGFVSVSGKGIICLDQNGSVPQEFLFSRSAKFRTVFETNSSSATESSSFWDSTAKPILVTLGAVAVIALFFLIRG